MTKLSWNKLTNNKKNFQTVWYIIARRKFDIRLFVVKTWWYLCLHFTHFIIGGYWSEDLRRWSQATHQKAQCILWTCPVHSLLGRSSYQSHSPRRELWPACVWNNKVMNLTYVFPFKEEKEIEISYSHSQELPLTLVEFSPPFNINSDRNISKFYWIWKLFTL